MMGGEDRLLAVENSYPLTFEQHQATDDNAAKTAGRRDASQRLTAI